MKRYLPKVEETMTFFDMIAFMRVPREENSQADALTRIGSAIEEESKSIDRPVQKLAESSIVQAD